MSPLLRNSCANSFSDKLHATRLLGIEERPFKRLTKRLLAPNTPINAFLARPNPSTENAESALPPDEQLLNDLQRFREDAILDFAAFESSIARIQFLRAANTRERERYVAEKLKIEATALEVRDNTASLRIQLDDAQKTLAVRKTYDVLAEKITKDAKLKERGEQHVNIEKLKAEIEELERESVEYNAAWGERREQFEKLMTEGMRLRRVIRDEKEVEKDEDTADGEGAEREQEHGERDGDQDDEHMLGVGRDREGTSQAGTPRPIDDAPTPLPAFRGSGAQTPRSGLLDGTMSAGGGATPRRPADEDRDVDVEMDAGPGATASETEKPAGQVEKVDPMDTS